MKKYYCKEKECNNEIHYTTWKYGKGRCHSCAMEKLKGNSKLSHKGKNNPNFGNPRKIKDKKASNYKDGRTLKIYYCKNCKKEIHKNTALYREGRCKSCAQKEELNHNWQGGKSFEPYPLGWTKTFKEQIRYRDKHKCQLCGILEIECDRRLHVHHKDYDKTNINSDNLISLCNSCHTKTNWNRKYWLKFFKENSEKGNITK